MYSYPFYNSYEYNYYDDQQEEDLPPPLWHVELVMAYPWTVRDRSEFSGHIRLHFSTSNNKGVTTASPTLRPGPGYRSMNPMVLTSAISPSLDIIPPLSNISSLLSLLKHNRSRDSSRRDDDDVISTDDDYSHRNDSHTNSSSIIILSGNGVRLIKIIASCTFFFSAVLLMIYLLYQSITWMQPSTLKKSYPSSITNPTDISNSISKPVNISANRNNILGRHSNNRNSSIISAKGKAPGKTGERTGLLGSSLNQAEDASNEVSVSMDYIYPQNDENISKYGSIDS